MNSTFHLLKHQFTDLTYMGGTAPCGAMSMIFGSFIKSWYTSLGIKFGVNQSFMCPRPQKTNLTYMEGTGTCEPMRIIFPSVI